MGVGSVLLHHASCPHILSSSSFFSLRISLKLLLVQGDQLPSFCPSEPFERSSAHVMVVNQPDLMLEAKQHNTRTVLMQTQNDVTHINLALKAGPHQAHTELLLSLSIKLLVLFYLWTADSQHCNHRPRKETGNLPKSWLITATSRDLGQRMTLAAMCCCCFSQPRPTLLWQACFIFNLKCFARITAAFKQVHPSQEGGERRRKVQGKEKRKRWTMNTC